MTGATDGFTPQACSSAPVIAGLYMQSCLD